MWAVALLAAPSGRLPRTSLPYLREVAMGRRSVPGGFPGKRFRPLGRVGALGVLGAVGPGPVRAKLFGEDGDVGGLGFGDVVAHPFQIEGACFLAAVADLGAADPEIDGVVGPFYGGVFH